MAKPLKPFDERSHLSVRNDDDVRGLLKRIWELNPALKNNLSVTLKSALYAYVAFLEGKPFNQAQPMYKATEGVTEETIEPVIEETTEPDNWQEEEP